MGTARRLLVLVVSAFTVLALAACGSRLDPDTVAQVSGGDGQVVGGVGDVEGSVDGGSGSGAVPGTGAVPGGGAGAGGEGTVGSSGGGGGGGGGGGASTGAPEATGQNAAGGGVKSASCDGFKNQTGITDDTITVANVSDISGPFPGLFESSQSATRAYAAFFNATSDICGRKLDVLRLDSRTDSGADQQAYLTACDKAFAAVGSMSGFDQGGAAAAEQCGIPDMRAISVSQERNNCAVCFAAQATNTKFHQNAVPDHIVKNYPQAATKAAMVYLNAAGAAFSAQAQVKADEKRGMKFVYVEPIDVAEFNYSPYVQEMKSLGVRYVQFIGPSGNAVRLAQAMKQQGFEPDVYALDPAAYNRSYVESGGDDVQGTRIFLNHALFTETSNKEMALYQSWLQQVDPGAEPDYFGLYSWSATRLFVQEALRLGGGLSRPALIGGLKTVKNWTSNGLHAPQQVGAKQTGECWRWIRLEGSTWVPDGSAKYTCNGLTSGA